MYIFAHVGLVLGAVLVLAYLLKWDLASIDIRVLLWGAMLPDIIDKPLAFINLTAGRAYAHTFVFFTGTVLLGLYFTKKELPYGVASHLVLDGIWHNPAVILWPVGGKTLLSSQYDFAYYWNQLFENKYLQITEVIGVFIIVEVIIRFSLYRKEHILTLIRKGRIWRN
jgi:hypothetical protein